MNLYRMGNGDLNFFVSLIKKNRSLQTSRYDNILPYTTRTRETKLLLNFSNRQKRKKKQQHSGIINDNHPYPIQSVSPPTYSALKPPKQYRWPRNVNKHPPLHPHPPWLSSHVTPISGSIDRESSSTEHRKSRVETLEKRPGILT